MSAGELRPTSGSDVLARRGDLVLLCSAGPAVDKLLQAQAEVAASGGDAEALATQLADVVAGEQLSLVAFGPSGNSLLVTVYGHAWADVVTEHGEQKLAMRQSRDGVRSVVPGRLQSVRAGIGDESRTEPLEWADLEEGVVRAGGLVMVAGGQVEPVVAAPPDEPPTSELPAVDDALPAPPPRTEVPPAPSPPPPVGEPVAPPPPPSPVGEPAAPPPPAAPVAAAPPPANEPVAAAPAMPEVDRSQRFSSVVLIQGAGIAPQAEQREPLPVITAPPEPAVPDVAPPQHPVDEGRVQVLGVYCKNGHFDDPSARYCAVCGISMAQLTLQPRPGPRPPLGVLVLDDGSIFSLDTDYVIGRDPAQDPDVVSGAARSLRFDDPEGVLSRRHARIVLDGWNVEVVDLGSANGTGVWGPNDTAWHPVPKDTPIAMRPGTQIGLGRRTLRYESHRNT